MNKYLKIFAIVIVLLPLTSILGQKRVNRMSYDFLSEKWGSFQNDTKYNLLDFNRRYFRDTVSLDEMKEAFIKNKDQRIQKSPYQGFDSIHSLYADAGESVMLLSPLKHHPKKEIRKCRGIWESLGYLSKLLDENGTNREDLLSTLKKDKEWLDGEIIALRKPRWYMGFAVSPVAYLEIYDKGKLVGMAPYVGTSDFFSYASPGLLRTHPEWYHSIGVGSRMMGALQTIHSEQHQLIPERTFSVLLYEKPIERSNEVEYVLVLLDPQDPDQETKTLFEDLAYFVNHIPSKSFMPLFTTDLRLMTGRYYKVTANKCGWLIEDYLNL